MKKAAIFFTLLIFATVNISAQELRKKAEESPLDIVHYLFSKDKNKNSYKIQDLAIVYFDLGKVDDTFRAIELADDNFSKIELLNHFFSKSFEKNNQKLANKILNRAMEILRTTNDKDDWDYDLNDRTLVALASNFASINRFAETNEILSHQTDADSKANLLFEIASSLARRGQVEKASKFADDIFKIDESFQDSDNLIEIARIYAIAGQREKANVMLEKIKNIISAETNEKNRQVDFLNIVPIYIKIGETEKAISIWNQHHNTEDYSDTYSLASSLISDGYAEKAKSYFLQIESDEKSLKYVRNELVENYLKLNDIEAALRIARIYFEDDDYHQQRSLMTTADEFIKNGQTEKALEILDFAYQKARKVGEIHLPQHSIGASPLTRKIIYLREIRNRYYKLGQFEKGLLVMRDFKTSDSLVKEFQSGTLIKYASFQVKTLPRKKLDKTLELAQSIFGEDDNRRLIRAQIDVAEVYAQIGDNFRAVQILTKVLKLLDYDDDEELIYVGKVFAENKLKTDAEMKNELRRIIEEAE